MAAEKKYRALIVDDSSMIRSINNKFLCKNGFLIEMAENGHQALELFRVGNRYDIVIMDMDLPMMGGLQAIKELREMKVKSLIIGMSACNSKTMIEAFMKVGLDDYYAKPMSMAKVAAIVARLDNKL